jgi:HAD superfamily hydrolase (TIGR01490 family)
MNRAIAFFDFDGTITKKDTLLEFIKYSKGNTAFYAGFCLHAHYLLAYKLKIITNQKAKEKILTHFFGNMPLDSFQQFCNRFMQEKIPQLIRPGAYKEIEKLQQNGVKIVIVSASPENWITQWSNQLNADLIATRLEFKNNSVTGKIDGFNCHGNEKVRRIKEKFRLEDFTEIYAYGDTSGDKPMLALAHQRFMKPFR